MPVAVHGQKPRARVRVQGTGFVPFVLFVRFEGDTNLPKGTKGTSSL
jgi:hypothetical protein